MWDSFWDFVRYSPVIFALVAYLMLPFAILSDLFADAEAARFGCDQRGARGEGARLIRSRYGRFRWWAARILARKRSECNG